MADDIASGEFLARLGEDARNVEGDITIADHHCRVVRKIRRKVGKAGMAVVPANERGTAENVGQVLTGQSQFAIVRRARGEDDRVIKLGQFRDGDVPANHHVADETNVLGQRGRFVTARHALDRLVIGRHAEPDQAVGNRQAIKDIDADIIAPGFQRGFGSVVSGRSRPHDSNMPQRNVLPCDRGFRLVPHEQTRMA